MEVIIITWIVFCFVAGYVGESRKIGFWSAFLLSIFLSPIVGLIVAFNSDKKAIINEPPIAMLQLIGQGDKLLEKGMTDMAMEKYILSLPYFPTSPHTNFKLAKIYSIKKDKDNSLKHLVKAVQDGFGDFESIYNNQLLSYLRSTSKFKSFALNGYKIADNQLIEAKPPNRIDELERLNNLMEKSVLTREEFEVEKKKILST